MEEMSLEEYKNKERQTERFFHDEDERAEMPFLAKAGIGIAVAAGVLSAGHRTGAMRKIARFLDTEGKATMQAFREIRDNQGKLFSGADKLSMERMKKMKDSFVERRTEIRDDLVKQTHPSNILDSRDMQMTKELRARERLIGEKKSEGNYTGELAYNIQEGYRFAAIMDDLRTKSSLSGQKNVLEELEKAMQKGELGILDWGSPEQTKMLLASHGKGVETTEVWDALEAVRKNYKGKDIGPQENEAYRVIEAMQEKIAVATAERIGNATNKNGAIKDTIIGHKQATVQDILDLNDAGKIRMNADLKVQINSVLEHNKDFAHAVFDDNLYLSTKNDELFDYNVFKEAGRSQMDWWSGTIPGGLLHLRDILNVKTAREQAGLKIFQRGTVLSSLNGHRGFEANEALNEEVLFMHGKFVRLNDTEAINSNAALEILNPNRDMYLTSSSFGTLGKMNRHMSGIMTDNETPRNLVAEVFDVGRQDSDGVLTQGVSMFTKFFKKDWERNSVKLAIKNGIESPEEFFKMNTYMKLNTEGFSARTLNSIQDQFPSHIKNFIEQNNINFSVEDDMVSLFKYIGEKEKNRKNSPHTELQTLFRQFDRDPDRVLNRKSPIGESNPILGHHTHMRTGVDEINQQTSLYLVNEMLLARQGSNAKSYLDLAKGFRQELKGMEADGKIFKDDLQQAEQLLNFSMYRSQGFDIFANRDAALVRTSKLFQEDGDFQTSMRQMARDTNPLWERYSSSRPENLVGDEYIAVNEAGVGKIFNQMFGMKSDWGERWDGAKDLIKQISPFTGRRNMEDVTTLTMFGNYYPAYRLQDALGNMGLGFSDASMGNAFQMMSALMLKRIAPVYLGVEGYKYADWKVDQITGEGIDERWENYKANDRLDEADGLDMNDKYQMQRNRFLKPGLEHWEAMPEIHLPGVGPVSMGDALNNIFAPFMGKATLREEDMMTYNETIDDLFKGTEEIRKSRYWFAGSKSAFRGDRITEFAPNSFRRAHSDYEWTNTSATGEEYWGNSLLPTMENPLGLLSFMIGERDPYWYEKKHEYDRPYMLTGELFNPNTMVLGDLGNATLGKLIKPVEEMHPEYWGDPVLIHEEETSRLGVRPDAPVRTKISAAGRIENDVLADAQDYGAEPVHVVAAPVTEEDIVQNDTVPISPSVASRYVRRSELDDNGNETGAYLAQDMETNRTMYVPANIAKEGIAVSSLFERASEPAPENSEMKAVVSTNTAPSYQAQISTQPRAMSDEEYAYKQDVMYRKMENAIDPRSAGWSANEALENWTEPLGVYKWIMNDEVLGRDPYAGSTVIQKADAAYNASGRFWESELGSLGSSMSEIGRRFIRRDDGMIDKYNPIRNEMPDWMPGEDYFINFQTGDPYSKISNGERRLPGEAYESLNELHPDETGQYGAFDKFKILADAAPFSDEYNFWSQYLLDTLEESDPLRKEATLIRKQVSERKIKYEFTPYRFKDNNITYEEVTVSKMLDDYTFLTEELGDQTIRLAGMQYRKKAEGVMESYFRPGDKVTIGIAEDETQRSSGDTYNTMRAVVFNNLGNINKQIIERGEMVENQNDFTAAGVHARFTPNELKRGERWETLAHASTPLNTKFLQVRTAVEEYERDQIYGKDWATWDNFMINDYIAPTLQGLGRFDNPLWSATAGATTGLVMGRFFLKGGRPTKIAGIAGAMFGLGANIFFKQYKKETGEVWIPERRRKENEINEYFDVLKYMKYEGLYQKAREEIVHATGYDIEDFAQLADEKHELTRERRKELEEEKKLLFVDQPDGWEDRRKEINKELEAITQDKDDTYLPDEFLQALSYKEERDTTLYAVDPFEDRKKVMRAFPHKDAYFFDEFSKANSKDRERILELVPENQRRIYKALWGMEVEDQKPIEEYMQKYDIPDWNWEGWSPDYDLDDVKVKAVQEAGLSLSDFNFWNDDVMASQYVPDLHPGQGNNYEQEQPPSNFEGFNALRQNLISVLQGQGLQDVQVIVSPSDGSETYVDVNYREDRSAEIEENLRRNAEDYV